MWYIHDVPIFVFVFSVAMRAVDFRYFVVAVVVFRHSRQFQILLEFLRRFMRRSSRRFLSSIYFFPRVVSCGCSFCSSFSSSSSLWTLPCCRCFVMRTISRQPVRNLLCCCRRRRPRTRKALHTTSKTMKKMRSSGSINPANVSFPQFQRALQTPPVTNKKDRHEWRCLYFHLILSSSDE